MYKTESDAIQKVIESYFYGIFYGDVEKLKSIFHSKAILFGDINGNPYLKDVTEYLEGVKNRKSPHSLNETFRMRILSIEIRASIAEVKAHVPMFEYNYYDYLALQKLNDWVIVNKLFTHEP